MVCIDWRIVEEEEGLGLARLCQLAVTCQVIGRTVIEQYAARRGVEP